MPFFEMEVKQGTFQLLPTKTAIILNMKLFWSI